MLMKKIDDLDKKREKDFSEAGKREKIEKTLWLGAGVKATSLASKLCEEALLVDDKLVKEKFEKEDF